MEEKEVLEQEIERLKKKVESLSAAYQRAVEKLDGIQQKDARPKRKGRPSIDVEKKAGIISLYRQGNTMRGIAGKENVAVSTVHKIIQDASAKSRVVYVYADREKPATVIDVCGLTEKVRIVNLTENLVSRAFGIQEKPDWKDYEEFLESRCMPRTRFGIREELKNLGLDTYDPFQIIDLTRGRVYGDHQYLTKMKEGFIRDFDGIMKKSADEKTRRAWLLELLSQREEEWKLNEGEY